MAGQANGRAKKPKTANGSLNGGLNGSANGHMNGHANGHMNGHADKSLAVRPTSQRKPRRTTAGFFTSVVARYVRHDTRRKWVSLNAKLFMEMAC
jgi:hypothetical protein